MFGTCKYSLKLNQTRDGHAYDGCTKFKITLNCQSRIANGSHRCNIGQHLAILAAPMKTHSTIQRTRGSFRGTMSKTITPIIPDPGIHIAISYK